jgi:membrane protease YdiL (CAAX protease family)
METPEAISDRRRFLTHYVIIAYGLSWAVEIPLALQAQGVIPESVPFASHYLAAFGPCVAGILMTWREGGRPGLKDLFSRILRWHVHPIWWIVALSPLLLFMVVSLVMKLAQGSWISAEVLKSFDFLPDLGGWVVLVWLATYGFGEEIGWRGYLLPRLQSRRTAWSATLILWAIWAAWHIPSFFYLHTASSPGMLAGFLIGVLAGAVFLTWLYNSATGSVLIVAVWHGLFDYVTACTECKSGIIAASISTIVMIWAVAVVLLSTPTNLSSKQRHALG